MANPAANDDGPRFRSWLALRDAGIERQQYDYSCGVAALATLLTQYHRHPVDEAALLAALAASADDDPRRGGVSLAQLAALAAQRGFPSAAVAVPWSAYRALKMPAIVYLRFRGLAHFSVLRGVDAQGRALLADPAWGNYPLSAAEFRRLFLGADGMGRMLVVGHPEADSGAGARPAYFRSQFPRALQTPAGLLRPGVAPAMLPASTAAQSPYPGVLAQRAPVPR
jgi:predicted double-glycine peptidase